MNPLETLRTAFNALFTNRLRALLTTLGIMIGVASVVSLMSLGGSLPPSAPMRGRMSMTVMPSSSKADAIRSSSRRCRATARRSLRMTATCRRRRISKPVASGCSPARGHGC